MPQDGFARALTAEILGIHLKLKHREPKDFDLAALAAITEGYTGADLREVIITGLKIAFHAEAKLRTEHLLQAVPEIRPLSKTDPEWVAAMTGWLERHTTPASVRPESATVAGGNGGIRKRRVTVQEKPHVG